jgi:magnesium chelatase accessory protein
VADAASPAPDEPPAWWPHRAGGRTVAVGPLRWYVQVFEPAASANARPLALLLHGTGASAHSWHRLAPLLAATHDVIAPDLPGHGFTATPASQPLTLPAVAAALGELLAVTGRRPALVIGHSAGAAIALQMALDGRIAPERVVSIAGAILPLPGPFGAALLPAARLLASQRLVASTLARLASWPALTRRVLAGTGSRIDASSERCYAHLLAQPAHAAGALRLMASWDLAPLERALPALRTPLLLLAGGRDRMLPPSHARRAQALVPGARLVELAPLGHLMHEEDADAVSAALQMR